MSERMQSFSVEIPVNDPKAMEEFQEVMNSLQDAMMDYEAQIAKELNCSEWAACDIIYLRSRSRWTQELENEILRLDKEGKHPPVLAWRGEPESEWPNI